MPVTYQLLPNSLLYYRYMCTINVQYNIAHCVLCILMNHFIVALFVPIHRMQLLAIRWRESEPVPEVVAMDTPAHSTTAPVVRSFSLRGHHSSTGSTGGNDNSGQLQKDEQEGEEEEEGEREEENEGSRAELPPSPPIPTPQLLIEALTASLKKVCKGDV